MSGGRWSFNREWRLRDGFGFARLDLAANGRAGLLVSNRYRCLLLGDDRGFLFVAQFTNRDRLDLSAACFFDSPSGRTFVDDGVIDDLDIGDVNGLVDDSGVINHYRGGANGFQEVPFFDKNIRPRRNDSLIDLHRTASKSRRRVQWRPADISTTAVPRNPGRRPLRLRHPIPAIFRAQIPAPVVIRGPGPRLIANPIPSGVGALPLTRAIGTPIGIHAPGNPAAAIRAHHLPSPVRAERLVKIIFRANRYPDRAGRVLELHRGRLHVHYFWSGGRLFVVGAMRPWLVDVANASRQPS